jgi:choline monooxygenase
MFLSQSHIPQVLSADDYTSQVQHDLEVERLFLPGWHCVALTSELPHDGDFLTLKLFGRPLIVWRSADEFHTFLNVCAHRYTTLSDQPCGHMKGRLRCQYHGWEYDETGNTRKIPDARSFRPMSPGMLGLTKYRTEVCGQAIYMTFDDLAPTLAEWLGPVSELSQAWITPDHVPVLMDIREHAANWKVVVENFLEAYHLECLHPTTFGTYPDESRCTHEFYDGWDWYRDDYSKQGNRLEWLISRGAGLEPKYTWHHLLRYPNTIYCVMALYSFVQTTVPTGPQQCRVFTRIVVHPGVRGRLRARIMGAILRGWGRRFWAKVIAEDARIFPSVQRGLQAADHPKGGLISIREERIATFQRYVRDGTRKETVRAVRPATWRSVAPDDPLAEPAEPLLA